MFDALLAEKSEDGLQSITLRRLSEEQLPPGDVTVRIEYSALNYKDALALTGNGPILRSFPIVPGIDFAGTVENSSCLRFSPGQKVILNGWGAGEKHWGGFSGLARVPGEWLVPLPSAFTTRQAMALGTAGYTAMLCVRMLQKQGVTPDCGDILVTGATGGVGSVAVMLLARLGYNVTAVTGRMEEKDTLLSLGACNVIPRQFFEGQIRPLEKARWAGAIDVAGGKMLAAVCASMQSSGVVAACGLAAGMDLPATVAPFILRGVILAGVDSVYCSQSERLAAWQDLAALTDPAKLESVTTEISLLQAVSEAEKLLNGQVKGRVVVKVA
ncbi:acrylyl-CoA reductase (NADPH) [Acetobacter thailandicus]|uniref:Oxidoreductase n=1 Tax=Acetobacter thailandicus TaxID=1502842 RepID=A0ABT3QB60_9PROT|nr:MDR family oxidoreductase [Acetobacter thailandicus]MCX2562515.1 oxidoreductase [Acetobacter thailandicus]NHN94583.1 acryloyl-CoA reductase [Acetobacter thailandicus]